ncbi:putative nucleotidyltransferase substrate binding domain-containing protein [Gracilimonas mengyeensis]|uniref:Nucleotidyltransferase DUF294 n=1 Tax=Gracilimonas mengyeensis TaxID=1302730 RepID=A0A521DEB0_9BACT|nr:putative nucleotidyltransferase substrate binding domain-containing protein [Gracilimonas mengyeensis]SMO69471.1 Putative nucleotidyltransferase DUF294 [Gracilimonas mengyeensis]
MNTHLSKKPVSRNTSGARGHSKEQGNNDSVFQFEDNRPAATAQRNLQGLIVDNSRTIQRKAFQAVADYNQKEKSTSLSSKDLETNGGIGPAVQFKTLFQVAPGNAVIQRQIHLGTPPSGLPKDLEVEQILERLHPIIRYDSLSRETRGYIIDLLDDYDEDDRVFDDIVDLAVTLDMDVRKEEPETGSILIKDEDAEIILDPKFQKMLESVPLPAVAQRVLASEIKGQARWMGEVYRDLSDMVKKRSAEPEEILKWFTGKTREFAVAIMRAAKNAFGLPSVPLTVLIAGSGARGEMFPGSDLDLAAVTEAQERKDVVEVFDFMQKVEKILQLTVQVMSHKLTSRTSDEVGLGPDTGVFGFKNSPELLAKHSLNLQNTGQDAKFLTHTAGGKQKGLGDRFFKARDELINESYGLAQLKEILNEFGPPPSLEGIMNIKTQFLRMPTLALRDLAQVCGLKSTNSFDRVRELVHKGYLDSTLGKQVIEALNHISGVRLQCHIHYGKEKDTFAVDESDKQTTEDYVLSSSERDNLTWSAKVLSNFYSRLVTYQEKRSAKKWGIFTGNTI